MNYKIIISLLFISLFFKTSLGKERIESLQMKIPNQFLAIMKTHNCSPILHFPPNLGVTSNIFLYKDQRKDNVFFWCKKNTTKNHVLAHIYKLQSSKKWLYEEIYEVDAINYLGNLSIYTDPDLKLRDFIYIKDGKPGPKENIPGKVFIRSGDDSLDKVFYKFKNKWLILIRC